MQKLVTRTPKSNHERWPLVLSGLISLTFVACFFGTKVVLVGDGHADADALAALDGVAAAGDQQHTFVVGTDDSGIRRLWSLDATGAVAFESHDYTGAYEPRAVTGNPDDASSAWVLHGPVWGLVLWSDDGAVLDQQWLPTWAANLEAYDVSVDDNGDIYLAGLGPDPAEPQGAVDNRIYRYDAAASQWATFATPNIANGKVFEVSADPVGDFVAVSDVSVGAYSPVERISKITGAVTEIDLWWSADKCIPTTECGDSAVVCDTAFSGTRFGIDYFGGQLLVGADAIVVGGYATVLGLFNMGSGEISACAVTQELGEEGGHKPEAVHWLHHATSDEFHVYSAGALVSSGNWDSDEAVVTRQLHLPSN